MDKITLKITLKTTDFIDEGWLQISQDGIVNVILTFNRGFGTFKNGILGFTLFIKKLQIGIRKENGKKVYFICEIQDCDTEEYIIQLGNVIQYPVEYCTNNFKLDILYPELDINNLNYIENEILKEEGRY